MDRRYQVFVSSTYEDLKVERQHVIRAALSMQCLPAGMEMFPASSEEAWSVIRKVIDDSDYYLLVMAGKYGSVDPTGASYTEREYDYAIAQGRPVAAFLHRDIGRLPRDATEVDPVRAQSLSAFRSKVETRLLCKHWDSPIELQLAVTESLVYLRDEHPGIGWVRGNRVASDASLAEVSELQARVIDLTRRLAEAQGVLASESRDLAADDDVIVVHYRGLARQIAERHPGDDPQPIRMTPVRGDVGITINDVLYAIGPSLMHEATAEVIEADLARFVQDRERDAGRLLSGTMQFRLAKEDFATIKLHLVALGLLAPSLRKRSVADKGEYWTLSPLGRSKAVALRAIHRGAPAEPNGAEA